MTTNPILPQGGIKSGNTVLLVTTYNNSVYIMGSTGIFRQSTNTVPQTDRLLLTLTANGNYITLTAGNNSVYYNTTGNVSYGVPGFGDVSTIFLNDTTYQELAFPFTVMSGVLYYPSGLETNIIPLLFEVDGVSGDVPLRIALIPASYYTNKGILQTGDDALNNSVGMFGHSYYPSTYTNYSSITGWTQQSQGIEANVYNYCTSGTVCTGNCFSGCQEGATCAYQGNKTYSCIEPEPLVIEKTTEKKPRVWLWIVGFIIIFILLLLFIWIIFYEEEPQEPAKYVTHESHVVNGNPV